jgi:HD-like signal output (HDOD) protein
MTAGEGNGLSYALVLQETEAIPRPVAAFLNLLLSYRYGLEVRTETSLGSALSASSQLGASLTGIFIVRDQPLDNRNPVMALGKRGQIPVFVLLPAAQVEQHQQVLRTMKGVYICAWEDALCQTGLSLQMVVTTVLDELRVGRVLVDEKGASAEVIQQRVERRLNHIDTLPTVPELILQITKLLADPATQVEDLEEILVSDPAIVHRLLKVVGSSALAGRRGNGGWTLREAIVRLGLKQVGAIAQQIKLINSLVKPENSPFNVRRFWVHSVGCAVIADKLYVEKLVQLQDPVPVDHYWIGAVLHDVGKLVMGFFFWDAFEAILQRMNTPKTPFHWAEARLGNAVTHEYLGQLMLLRAKADPEIVELVKGHNNVGRKPSPLVCLVNVADNLCKDLGLGYLEKEQGVYSPAVLAGVGLSEEQLQILKDTMGQKMTDEVEDLVGLCLGH